MSRYIDADRLLIVLEKNFGHTSGAAVMKDLIDMQPTAEVQPVVHGKWINNGDYMTTAYGSLKIKKCSNCECEITIDDYENYCPNCGAKMEAQ